MPIPTPDLITEAFGASAVDITLPIPVADPGGGAASFTLGFPHVTKLPISSGGVPPDVEDVNGILHMVSAYAAYLGAGQLFPFNATLAAAMGGYANDALISMADGKGYWRCVTANTTVNPDTPTPPSLDWVPLGCTEEISIPVTTGTRVLSAAEARCSTIIITGTQSGDVVIQVPLWAGARWKFINNVALTGLSVTVKGPSGTGFVLQQSTASVGDLSSPVGIWCDGTNVYGEFASLHSPQLQGSPTCPLQTPGNNSTLIANCHYVDSAGFAPEASPTFTGNPTAPTQSAGDSSTKLATTAFVNPPGSVVTGGGPWNEVRASAAIEKWGKATYTTNTGAQSVVFSTAFPTACEVVMFSEEAASIGWDTWIVAGSISTTGFQFNDDAASGNTVTLHWRAIGH